MDLNQVYHGDCFELVRKLADDSVDLIVTSPPYGLQRQGSYGGVDPDQYVEWFLPLSAELLRALKPTGSFVLNIKEHVSDGERHTYVLELVLALRRQGWRWAVSFANDCTRRRRWI